MFSSICLDFIAIWLNLNFDISSLNYLRFGDPFEEGWLRTMKSLPLKLCCHVDKDSECCEDAVYFNHYSWRLHEFIAFLYVWGIRFLRLPLSFIPIKIEPFLGCKKNPKKNRKWQRSSDKISIHHILVDPSNQKTDALGKHHSYSNCLQWLDVCCYINQLLGVGSPFLSAGRDQIQVIIASVFDQNHINDQCDDYQCSMSWCERSKYRSLFDE